MHGMDSYKMCMKYREGGFYLMLSFWMHICSLVLKNVENF